MSTREFTSKNGVQVSIPIPDLEPIVRWLDGVSNDVALVNTIRTDEDKPDGGGYVVIFIARGSGLVAVTDKLRDFALSQLPGDPEYPLPCTRAHRPSLLVEYDFHAMDPYFLLFNNEACVTAFKEYLTS